MHPPAEDLAAGRLPTSPGTYALVLRCRRARRLRVGRLGEVDLRPGWYVYVGSAFGPGGLRARCGRHLRGAGRRRWHIDFLRAALRVHAVWYSADPVPLEHGWAELLAALPGSEAPIPRFGASDCRCRSHLFFTPRRPSAPAFRRAARKRFGARSPIVDVAAAPPASPRPPRCIIVAASKNRCRTSGEPNHAGLFRPR